MKFPPVITDPCPRIMPCSVQEVLLLLPETKRQNTYQSSYIQKSKTSVILSVSQISKTGEEHKTFSILKRSPRWGKPSRIVRAR